MVTFGSITINLFSIILVLAACLIMFLPVSYKKKYVYILIINCILEIFQLQGYFIAFGTTEVSYPDFWMVVLILFSIPMLVQEKYDYKLAAFCALMVFSAVAGMVMEIIYPFNGEIIAYDTKGGWDAYILGTVSPVPFRYSVSRFILYFVRIVMYIFTVYIIKTRFSAVDMKNILNKISKIVPIYIWYGLFEFVTKILFKSSIIHAINKFILGLGVSTYSSIRYRDGMPMLQCFTREPSHYTQALFYIAVLLLLNKKIQNKFKLKNMIDIALIIFIMLISRSFAAVLYMAIIFILVMVLRKNAGNNIWASIKRIRILLIAGLLAVICMIVYVLISPESYIADRLINSVETLKRVLNNTWQTYRLSSEMTRMVSIYETFIDFLSRPLFGLGLAVEISHGGLVNILADVGIAGVFAWYKMSFYKINKKTYDKFMLILFIFMSNLFVGSSTLIFSSMMIIIIESTCCYVLREKSEVYKLYESIAY